MLVTHDMGVIAETADRVAVMYAGRIVEVGPVAAVVRRAKHPYTIGLLGSIPLVGYDVQTLNQIAGTMPRLDAIPAGCPFNPRCPHAFTRRRPQHPAPAPVHRTAASEGAQGRERVGQDVLL